MRLAGRPDPLCSLGPAQPASASHRRPLLWFSQVRGLSSTGVLMPSKIQIYRRQAFQRQQGRCFYCSVSMWLLSPTELTGSTAEHPAYARLRCTAEHLVARCDGGGNSSGNIVAACAHCNATRHKRKRPPVPCVYRKQVLARVRRGGWHHPWVYRHGLVSSPRINAESQTAKSARQPQHV